MYSKKEMHQCAQMELWRGQIISFRHIYNDIATPLQMSGVRNQTKLICNKILKSENTWKVLPFHYL